MHRSVGRYQRAVFGDGPSTESAWHVQDKRRIRRCVCKSRLFDGHDRCFAYSFDLQVSYDMSLKELRVLIQDQLVSLLFDPSSVVKRATLLNISNLCVFFGRQITNDVLLSHMITYLNDRDWMLRWAFFNSIVGVATFLGKKSLEEYVLPLMIQALSGTCQRSLHSSCCSSVLFRCGRNRRRKSSLSSHQFIRPFFV